MKNAPGIFLSILLLLTSVSCVSMSLEKDALWSLPLDKEDQACLDALVRRMYEQGMSATMNEGEINYSVPDLMAYQQALKSSYKEFDTALRKKIIHPDLCTVSKSPGTTRGLVYGIFYHKHMIPCPPPTPEKWDVYGWIKRDSMIKNLTVFHLISQNNVVGLFQWMIIKRMRGRVFKGKPGRFPFFIESAGAYAAGLYGKQSLIALLLNTCAYLHTRTDRLCQHFEQAMCALSEDIKNKEKSKNAIADDDKQASVDIYLDLEYISKFPRLT